MNDAILWSLSRPDFAMEMAGCGWGGPCGYHDDFALLYADLATLPHHERKQSKSNQIARMAQGPQF